MATIQNKLILVGGAFKVREFFPFQIYFLTSDNLVTLNEDNYKVYVEEYNRMNVSRSSATSVGYKDMLIITGGLHGPLQKVLSSTELLNTTTDQWFTCDDLPQPHFCMQPTILGASLYLSGGKSESGDSSTVFTASLDTLLQGQITWKPIQNTPRYRSAATGVCGTNLVAIGGYDKCRSFTSDVFTIDHDTHSWKIISQIPEERVIPSVITTSDDKIVVLGGAVLDHHQKVKITKTIWFGHLSSYV